MTSGTAVVVASALGIALLSSGCAGLTKPPSVSSPDEVALLKERLLELQRQVTVHEVEIARLKSQLSGRQNTAFSSLDAHQLPTAVPTPTESFELPVAVPPAFENEDLPPSEEAIASPSGASGSGRSMSLPNDQQSLYNLALERLRERRFEEAEAAFRKLLDRYPQTELSDNASYWLGESLYSRGEYRQAFEIFRQTVERYPEGNKVPDALLKVGLCLERTGDRQGARDVLEEVVRRFPATAASVAATVSLEKLD